MTTRYTDQIIIRFIPINDYTTSLKYNFDIDTQYNGEWEARNGIELGMFNKSLTEQILKVLNLWDIELVGRNDYMLWGKTDGYFVTIGIRNIDSKEYYMF